MKRLIHKYEDLVGRTITNIVDSCGDGDGIVVAFDNDTYAVFHARPNYNESADVELVSSSWWFGDPIRAFGEEVVRNLGIMTGEEIAELNKKRAEATAKYEADLQQKRREAYLRLKAEFEGEGSNE